MLAILIPIKHLGDAKQRLAPLLSSVERAGLAQAMMDDVFAAVRGVRAAERVFVATNYEPAIVQAERHGWMVIRETRQVSESDSVDAASRECESRGVTALLRLPIDLPLITAADIDEIFAATRDSSASCAVLVPSRDGTGTNALLRARPALFASHFGPGSFAKHLAEARTAGARVVTLKNPRIELDVDEPDDLRALLAKGLDGTFTGRWIERSGIADRLFTGAGMRI
jgi:2-phospho-L-lactate/phosphoenolpyruvate guanylyltransferase